MEAIVPSIREHSTARSIQNLAHAIVLAGDDNTKTLRCYEW
jgi:hypothetical protein